VRRKEIKARSITQSNDATCHKATKRSKRNASKKARQAMQHEVKEAVSEYQLRVGIMHAFRKAIDAGYEVDLLGQASGIDVVPDVRLREHTGVPEFWAREVFEVFKDRGIVPADTDIDAKIEDLRASGYRFAPGTK